MMNEEVEKIIRESVNLPIWQAKKGNGSFLTFDMGDKVIRSKRNGTNYETGSIHLWIYLCDWKLAANGEVISRSNSTEGEIVAALKYLNGKHLLSIIGLDENTVELKFSGEIVLTLEGNEAVYEKEDDFFIFYTSKGNLSYNRQTGFIVESAAEV